MTPETALVPVKTYVSFETEGDDIRRQNLYILSGILGFIWIFFHFLAVFFFGLVLESALLVGIFLWLGNLVALLVDIPVGVIQRYASARFLFVIGACCIFIASLVFLKFIYFLPPSDASTGELATSVIAFFTTDLFNILLLLLAAVCYGLAKEINDVTILTYILNNSDPSEYAKIISRNSIATGIGSFAGLVVSGFIIPFDQLGAVLGLITAICAMFVFLVRFFDNPHATLHVSDLSQLKLIIQKQTVEKIRDFAVSQVKKVEIAELAKAGNILFLRPLRAKTFTGFSEIIQETKSAMTVTLRVLFEQRRNFTLLWIFAVILCFGFWDTFVATFQIEFLNKLLELNHDNVLVRSQLLSGYLLLGLLIIPVFALQSFFIKLSKTFGVFLIVVSGMLLSAVSILLFGLSTGLEFVVLFWLLNSFGYAAAMPLAQATFLDTYNTHYSEKFALKEIDSNASAAPLKMLLNFANIVGLVLGWALVTIIGFNTFFTIFGLILFALFVASVVRRSDIRL